MKKYRTIIVADQKISQKIELYRHFLEKSEFKTCLDHAIFLTDDSVEGIPSTELNNVQNFVYLFGVINKEQYETHRNLIEEKCRKYQNGMHYMLFCRDPYQEEAYDASKKTGTVLNKPFSIGILDEELPENREDQMLKEELNCIKLLVLAMAICKFNETKAKAHFESYYMCADIRLDYKNIYYSIMHDMSVDADRINEKEREIRKNKELMSLLKARKDSICTGIFGDVETADTETGLKPNFSDYKSTEILQRDMENAYKIGHKSVEDSVKHKIDTARCALAIEEKYDEDLVLVVKDGHLEFEHTTNSKYLQKYMDIDEFDDEKDNRKVAQPADLLEKPVKEHFVDSVQISALLPLTREFEKNRKFNFWIPILSAFCVTVVFLVLHGLLYFARYKVSGVSGVTRSDFINVMVKPAIVLLLTGITGLIAWIIRYLYCKSVFKKAYEAIKNFIDNRRSMCEAIRDYINKYLTVYYNHHIKHSRIEDLQEQNVVIEHEIKEIRKGVSPTNRFADIICLMNGSRIEIPKLVPGSNGEEDSLSMRRYLETEVKENTEVLCSDETIKTTTPWAIKIAYGIGNMNSGGGN